MKCRRCKDVAQVVLPSHNTAFCPDCFFLYYERQVARAVKEHELFAPEDRILMALSGGKDSLAMARVLKGLGYDVTAMHVTLGIPESSDSALAIVENFCQAHAIELMVVDAPALGLAIPEVKKATNRPICSACGQIKRSLFNRTAAEGGFNVLATGHNLDDEAARLFANTLRWDLNYLSEQGPSLPAESGFVKKVKPLYRLTEYENACYAFLKGIQYGAAPCPYSPGASFSSHKQLIEELELVSPGSKISFYDSFLKFGRPAFAAQVAKNPPSLRPCARCGSPTIGEVCGVCHLKQAVAKNEKG